MPTRQKLMCWLCAENKPRSIAGIPEPDFTGTFTIVTDEIHVPVWGTGIEPPCMCPMNMRCPPGNDSVDNLATENARVQTEAVTATPPRWLPRKRGMRDWRKRQAFAELHGRTTFSLWSPETRPADCKAVSTDSREGPTGWRIHHPLRHLFRRWIAKQRLFPQWPAA